jgi:hypothetical protein
MLAAAQRAILVLLLAGLSSTACSGIGEMLDGISEPIPLGTPFVTGLDASGWQSRPAVPIGTAQEAGGLILVVNDVVRPGNQLAELGFSLSSPEPGKEYLAVELTATCNSPADQVCAPSPFDFAVSGNRGVTYVAELLTSGRRTALTSGGLPGGESRTGYLIFEVHSDDGQLLLRYPNLFGGLAGSGAFQLED